ncbi:hypothetical protein F0562_003865 [Nyssa sinensis]|uniref:Uncharacterized protein n=1 Tax=Nyssa sinensis TaxID=561372 RepID=A0A5J5C1G1_9ASTE|nr:hypothetical protein F0562_003865 [Nyssa sinensis]
MYFIYVTTFPKSAFQSLANTVFKSPDEETISTFSPPSSCNSPATTTYKYSNSSMSVIKPQATVAPTTNSNGVSSTVSPATNQGKTVSHKLWHNRPGHPYNQVVDDGKAMVRCGSDGGRSGGDGDVQWGCGRQSCGGRWRVSGFIGVMDLMGVERMEVEG